MLVFNKISGSKEIGIYLKSKQCNIFIDLRWIPIKSSQPMRKRFFSHYVKYEKWHGRRSLFKKTLLGVALKKTMFFVEKFLLTPAEKLVKPREDIYFRVLCASGQFPCAHTFFHFLPLSTCNPIFPFYIYLRSSCCEIYNDVVEAKRKKVNGLGGESGV
jgi:hypothetical protein